MCLSESAYANRYCTSIGICGAADDAGSAASDFLCLSDRKDQMSEEVSDIFCKCSCHFLFRVLGLFLRFVYWPKETRRLRRVLDPPELCLNQLSRGVFVSYHNAASEHVND